MKYDIGIFELLVKEGLVRKSEKDDLVLYGYTDKCTFERAWNEYTRAARGLILNKNTGEVVAKPFPKFFNLGEMEDVALKNLPKKPYTVTEKVDGSLGIVFKHNGKWQVATRGSFYSDQSIVANELLKNYKIDVISGDFTLLVEIVYPENKIIVNYGEERKLVLLAAYDRTNGVEYTKVVDAISDITGIPKAKTYNYTIEEMIELQKTLPKDQEGFVVRFEDGLRVKIKGHEYLRIAKIISELSPISCWEVMKEGKVSTFYISQLPEELKGEFQPIIDKLESQYSTVMAEIKKDLAILPTQETSKEARKIIGLFIKEPTRVKHKSAMFPSVLKEYAILEKYVMNYIRPNANIFKEL